MVFNVADIQSIKHAAETVISQATYQATRFDCLDNPEYLACEIIALVEWCSASINHNGAIAKLVLESYPWPQGVAIEVKAQFNLPY